MFIPYFTSTEREWEYRQKVPWVVPGLILACVMIHCYLSRYLGAEAQSDLYYRYGVVPAQLGWDRWYTPFTCTLLHGGWLHLAGNCYFLWLYGISMERLLGSGRFLVLYGGGAVISMWVQVWTLPTVMMDLPLAARCRMPTNWTTKTQRNLQRRPTPRPDQRSPAKCRMPICSTD